MLKTIKTPYTIFKFPLNNLFSSKFLFTSQLNLDNIFTSISTNNFSKFFIPILISLSRLYKSLIFCICNSIALLYVISYSIKYIVCSLIIILSVVVSLISISVFLLLKNWYVRYNCLFIDTNTSLFGTVKLIFFIVSYIILSFIPFIFHVHSFSTINSEYLHLFSIIQFIKRIKKFLFVTFKFMSYLYLYFRELSEELGIIFFFFAIKL